MTLGTVVWIGLLILISAGLVYYLPELFKGGRSYRASIVALRTVRVLDPQTRARWTELVKQGNMIQAIKDIRVATGLGLKEAEEVIDVLSRGLQPNRGVPARTEERARELFAQGRGRKAIKLIRRRWRQPSMWL